MLTREQLIDYLNSDANEHGLDAIATHGFLTATVVGKPLPNWLTALFEGQEDSVADAVKTALQQWQQDILTELKNEQSINLPFYTDSSDDAVDFSAEADISVWSVGFIDAMYTDHATDWFADSNTEDDVAMLTLPMVVFSGIDDDDDTLQDIRRDDDLLAQMVNSIEGNITELFLLFHTPE